VAEEVTTLTNELRQANLCSRPTQELIGKNMDNLRCTPVCIPKLIGLLLELPLACLNSPKTT